MNRHYGLAITSLILGSLSVVCCTMAGLGMIPALIGTIFGIICVVRGGTKTRKLGIAGLMLSAIGLIFNGLIVVYGLLIVNWDNLTWDNLMTAVNVDRTNPDEMLQWIQKFVKIDVTSLP